MPDERKTRLWGGRFDASLSPISEQISESISFDHLLYSFDIEASLAHSEMLFKQGILKPGQFENIQKGLKQVLAEFEQQQVELNPALEDIHTHVETRLVELIGEDGKRLHTGRSRNDQVATDTHLYLRFHMLKQRKMMVSLLETLVARAAEHKKTLWAGYTHAQIAQPVLLAHYLLAYFEKFKRDLNLLDFCLNEIDFSPLGAGAMAGPNYPVDREYSAERMGFSHVYQNSMDAVSNRDYQLNYLFFCSRFFIHTSRLCEDLILYNTAEFSYIRMSDAVTTGSSIMPQKKNPDIAELLRGKSARVIANFHALLLNLESLPLTYNRDLQEDKVYLFDSVKQIDMALLGLKEIIANITFKPSLIRKNLANGFAQATDIADYLVINHGYAFRTAHEASGALVKICEENRITLEELSENQIESVLGDKVKLPGTLLTLENSVNMKQGTGSTNPDEVERQIQRAELFLEGLQNE